MSRASREAANQAAYAAQSARIEAIKAERAAKSAADAEALRPYVSIIRSTLGADAAAMVHVYRYADRDGLTREERRAGKVPPIVAVVGIGRRSVPFGSPNEEVIRVARLAFAEHTVAAREAAREAETATYSHPTGDGLRDAATWAREAYAAGDSISDD